MLNDRDVLEFVLAGYEKLRDVAREDGMEVDELVLFLKNELDLHENSCFRVKVRGIIEDGVKESDSGFIPVNTSQSRKRLMNIVKSGFALITHNEKIKVV
jgi:predicted DNA-binding ribbon-helix-helix protein